jgi:hypothetical protein
MGEPAIIKAIDDACGDRIGNLVSVLVENLIASDPDAGQKFETGLQIVLRANRIARQAVTPSVQQVKAS